MKSALKGLDSKVQERILFLEKVETATLSINSSILLISHAIIFYIYGFGLQEYLSALKVFAAVAAMALIARIYVSAKIKNGVKETADRYWSAYQWTLWIYAASFSAIFHLISIEQGVTSPHFVVMIALTTAYSVSILHTTSYDLSIYIPLQVFFISPQLTAFFLELREVKENDYVYAMLFLLLNHLLYIISQYKKVNKKRYEKFRNEVVLEIVNEKLERSQNVLIHQTKNTIYQSRLAAVGEMSAGLSHEINNPLAIIRGNVEFMKRIITDESHKKQYDKLLQSTLKGIDRISYIVSGLKDFSRQKQTTLKEPVALSTIIDETFVFCSEMLKAHDVQLKIHPVPEVQINCKPLQISQVLYSIIKNAYDALIETSETNKWIEILFEETPSDIFIFITNNGIKIPEEHHDKLFQPFFTSKEPGKGIGLALSISLGIVQEHFGELLYNRASEFTTFTVKLPKFNE